MYDYGNSTEIKLTIIDIEKGLVKYQFDDNLPSNTINDISIANNGRVIVCGGRLVRFYDKSGVINHDLTFSDIEDKSCISVHPNNNILAMGGINEIQLYDINAKKITKKWTLEQDRVSNLRVKELEFNRQTGNYLLSSYSHTSGNIQIWNPVDKVLYGPMYNGENANISFDGSKIIYSNQVDNKNKITVADVKTGKPISDISLKENYSLSHLSFSSDGNEIITTTGIHATFDCHTIGENQIEVSCLSVLNGDQVSPTFLGIDSSEDHNNNYMKTVASNLSNNQLVAIDTATLFIYDKKSAKIDHFIKLPSNLDQYENKHNKISPDGKLLLVISTKVNDSSIVKSANKINSDVKVLSDIYSFQNGLTNLAEVTNNLLKETIWNAPVCAGFSERTIADGIAITLYLRAGARYPMPQIPNINIGLSPSHHEPIEVICDDHIKKIVVKLPVFIDFYYKNSNSSHRICRTKVKFNVFVQPSMAIIDADSTANHFQLDFSGSELDQPFETTIIDPKTILNKYGDIITLTSSIETLITNMLTATGEGVSKYLQSVIIDAPMPDSWNRMREYEFIFRGFAYRKVQLKQVDEIKEVGYLFILFSLVSLNLPPECSCSEVINKISFNNNENSDGRRLFTLGFSEDSLNVLLSPHRITEVRKKTSSGGSLYYAVNSYAKAVVERIEIVDDKINAEIDVKGGGSLTAGLRINKFGIKISILRETVGLKIEFNNIESSWEVNSIYSQDEGTTSIILVPKLVIGNIYVGIDSDSIPDVIENVINKVTSWCLSELIRPFLNLYQRIAGIELVYDIYNNKDQLFRIVSSESQLFKDSSLVLMGEIDACIRS